MTNNILICDGEQRSTLAVTRSLGSKGHSIYIGSETPHSLAGSSKFCKEQLQYPSPISEPLAFIDKLKAICKQFSIDILIPTTDITAYLLSKYKHEISNTKIPIMDFSTLEMVSDKYRLFQFANEIGVPIPKTIFIDNLSELAIKKDSLQYPLIVKPFRSQIYTDTGFIHTQVERATSEASLMALIEQQKYLQEYPFMLQELIEGDGQGMFLLTEQGNVVAEFCHKRIREKPPRGGVSVLSESAEPPIQLKKFSYDLLQKTRWSGVAMVEYKVSKDGTPYLMEINTRFWGSLQLAIDAGVDFPLLLIQNNHSHNPHSYDKQIRLRWLLGDLDRLYLVWKDKQFPLSKKITESFIFFNPFHKRTRHEVNRLRDFKPFLFELKKYISDLRK
ncbi:MAG: ATP-grasp domain-containing protein [Gammaproteobacteria bacterium]|nr:ATP-grasp domain-containing protein [Gammaproteobacteria bacterium]